MTPEQAVDILKNEIKCIQTDCARAECRECRLVMPEDDILRALDMAIRALARKGEYMTTAEMAQMLDGRQYLDEITEDEELLAEENGLVVVFGYSDDNAEFRGAIDDEIGCYEGADIWVTDSIAVPALAGEKPENVRVITAVWGGKSGAAWEYKTDIPHDTFNIYEDDELFCVGIVFSVEDLK